MMKAHPRRVYLLRFIKFLVTLRSVYGVEFFKAFVKAAMIKYCSKLSDNIVIEKVSSAVADRYIEYVRHIRKECESINRSGVLAIQYSNSNKTKDPLPVHVCNTKGDSFITVTYNYELSESSKIEIFEVYLLKLMIDSTGFNLFGPLEFFVDLVFYDVCSSLPFLIIDSFVTVHVYRLNIIWKMYTCSENEAGANQNVDLSTMNSGLREALISCARDEIRKLISDMVTPESISFVAAASRKNSNLMKDKQRSRSPRIMSPKRHTRPMTACSVPSSMTKAYRPGRTKSCSKIDCTRNKKVLLSRREDVIYSGQALSFASTKWIEKSANIIDKSSEEICNIQETKTGKSTGKIDNGQGDRATESLVNTIEQQQNINEHSPSQQKKLKRSKSWDTSKLCNSSRITNGGLSRPSTAFCKSSRITKRSLSRPTTALERRAPFRPSTAHFVRAKVEDFSHNLLRPIIAKQANDATNPIPFAMGEHEWENELARHVVSVYNNKIVSDVKDFECSKPMAEDTTSCSPDTKLFFAPAPLSESATSVAPNIRRPMAPPASSKTKIVRQTKQLMNSTSPRMVWIEITTGATPYNWNELEGKPNILSGQRRVIYNILLWINIGFPTVHQSLRYLRCAIS